MAETVLGIDYGARRIGVAIADLQLRVATPLTTLDSRNEATRDARLATDLGQEQTACAFVVGLPVNMSGSDSEQTRLTRRFADELARLSAKPVHLQDERLTSDAAEEVLEEAAVSQRRRKGLTDRIAAQKILQAWLDAPPPTAQIPES